jgi:hypothetical protein
MRFGTLSLAAPPARSSEFGLERSHSIGSVENIDRMKGYLNDRAELEPIPLRWLEIMQYHAADVPQMIQSWLASGSLRRMRLEYFAPLHEWPSLRTTVTPPRFPQTARFLHNRIHEHDLA